MLQREDSDKSIEEQNKDLSSDCSPNPIDMDSDCPRIFSTRDMSDDESGFGRSRDTLTSEVEIDFCFYLPVIANDHFCELLLTENDFGHEPSIVIWILKGT